MNILIVEDEPEIQEIYAEMFQMDGHSVQAESNGADGLLTLGQHSFDLVICDVMMPILDGIGFLKVARTRFPNLPIVIISGGSKFSSESILALGASSIFNKTSLDCKEIISAAFEWTKSTNPSPSKAS
jgi:CheY-like chemotaxis protein